MQIFAQFDTLLLFFFLAVLQFEGKGFRRTAAAEQRIVPTANARPAKKQLVESLMGIVSGLCGRVVAESRVGESKRTTNCGKNGGGAAFTDPPYSPPKGLR